MSSTAIGQYRLSGFTWCHDQAMNGVSAKPRS